VIKAIDFLHLDWLIIFAVYFLQGYDVSDEHGIHSTRRQQEGAWLASAHLSVYFNEVVVVFNFQLVNFFQQPQEPSRS